MARGILALLEVVLGLNGVVPKLFPVLGGLLELSPHPEILHVFSLIGDKSVHNPNQMVFGYWISCYHHKIGTLVEPLNQYLKRLFSVLNQPELSIIYLHVGSLYEGMVIVKLPGDIDCLK